MGVIDEALAKLQKVGPKAVEKFKKSDEHSDKLCDYYMEGFGLFRKYMAKHQPNLDFSTLDMEEVEREILANRHSDPTVENMEMMEDDTTITVKAPTYLSPSNLS
nr:hypothetical protein CFP56_38093 [Quercus suber]